MPIKQSDIEKVAQLAHLELAEEELKTFGPQIAEIVNYVEQLNELDTANIEPAIGGLTSEGARTDSARNDEIAGSLGQKPRSRKLRIQRSATFEFQKCCKPQRGTKNTETCRGRLSNFP